MTGTEKIRVLVDAHVFDQEFQGTRTFVRELYRSMAGREGLDLFFAATDTHALKLEFPGVPDEHFIRYKSRASWYRLLIDIPRIIKQYRIDYAHFQYIVPLWKNCRYIVTIHDVIFREHPDEFPFLYRFFKTILYRFGAIRADILTTVSGYSKHSIEKYLHINTEKIILTPLAVDKIFFADHDKTAIRKAFAEKYGFEKFILCVSRFESRKNQALLVKNYLELALYRQGYFLVMLGHRSLPVPELDVLLDGLSEEIRSYIIIRSDVPDAELPLFYRAAALFVYPSKAEGFGLPPLEAAAAKTPVICSNTTAMAGFVFFGEGHIDPADETSFKKLLLKMMQRPPGAEQLTAVAGIIATKYSWDVSAESLYEALLTDHRQQLSGKFKDDPDLILPRSSDTGTMVQMDVRK